MNTPIESKSQERALTSTSFGVLSLLTLRDHSTYELTLQMRQALDYLWPRANSNVYAEAKRLVASGLAEARVEWNGDRRRTIYSITAAGRQAVTEWLSATSSRPRFESEALLKVFFAENGTRDTLLAAIEELGESARAALEHFQRIADRYDEGQGDYPERFALSGLTVRLICEQQAATARWAAWAEQVVAKWPDPAGAGADWGVAAVRATGEPFPLSTDPVDEVVRPHRARTAGTSP
jgi:DNA-binding PadR family transcriptional regulator